MKKIALSAGIIVALLVIGLNKSEAQEKVTKKELLGKWQLVIDIEEALEEAEDDLDEEDDWFGKMIVRSVSGLVGGIMENIEIYFDFREDGELKIIVDAFGERETEYSEWEIIDGKLYISDTENDNININIDDDDYWMFDGDILVSFEEGRYRDSKEDNVYLKRIY